MSAIPFHSRHATQLSNNYFPLQFSHRCLSNFSVDCLKTVDTDALFTLQSYCKSEGKLHELIFIKLAKNLLKSLSRIVIIPFLSGREVGSHQIKPKNQ